MSLPLDSVSGLDGCSASETADSAKDQIGHDESGHDESGHDQPPVDTPKFVYVDRIIDGGVKIVRETLPAEAALAQRIYVHESQSRRRDVMRGRAGEADLFVLSARPGYGKKRADIIIEFSNQDGDQIEISKSAFGMLGLSGDVRFAVVASARELKGVRSSDLHFAYLQESGKFYFNQNGADVTFWP